MLVNCTAVIIKIIKNCKTASISKKKIIIFTVATMQYIYFLLPSLIIIMQRLKLLQFMCSSPYDTNFDALDAHFDTLYHVSDALA
jgi:hypothetical protein